MQTVSQAWKDAQLQYIVPESFVEVSLNVGDPESQADAQSASNGEEFYSDATELVRSTEKNPVKYATLESNQWLLDGTFIIMPDNAPYGDNGYIGDILSDENGLYSQTPTITISFSKVFDNLIPGITVEWSEIYNEYASDFRVTVYNGELIVQQMEVTGNKEIISVAEMDIVGYDKIVVEVLKWSLPHRRPRIREITVGVIKRYTKGELLSYSHRMFVDPLSASLPNAEITFEIVNLNGEYNPDNPQGAEKYLMERQMIQSRYGYKLGSSVQWIKAGTFFMSEWETPQNGISATFTARDSLEYMSDKYTGRSTGSLMQIATDAFTQANLPLLADESQRWRIDDSLSDITVPPDSDLKEYSIAEVLQYCAHAACCVFYQDRDGIVHIEPLPEGKTDYSINRFNSFANSEITLSKPLKAVTVNSDMHTLTISDSGETQDVTNPLVTKARSKEVAEWTANYLVNRKELSGEFRADPRLDALDRITNINQFAETEVLVTEVSYSYNGAFRGNYIGRSGV